MTVLAVAIVISGTGLPIPKGVAVTAVTLTRCAVMSPISYVAFLSCQFEWYGGSYAFAHASIKRIVSRILINFYSCNISREASVCGHLTANCFAIISEVGHYFFYDPELENNCSLGFRV